MLNLEYQNIKLKKYQLPQDLFINQIQPQTNIKNAHQNSIESLAANPSSNIYATGSHDKTIKIWDINQTRKQISQLSHHTQGVWSLDYSNDGKILVSASPDKTILIYDNKKTSPSHKLIGHQDKIYKAKINQNNKYIASVGQGSQLLIWDLSNLNKPLHKIQLNFPISYDIAWSGDNIFVTSIGGRTSVVDMKTLQILDNKRIDVHTKVKTQTISLDFNLLPNKIFVGCQQGLIIQYQFKDNKLVQKLQFVAHVGTSCRNIRLHNNKKYMISTGKDGSVRLWNCKQQQKPKIVANLVYHQNNVTNSVFFNQSIAITSSWDQNVAIWNLNNYIQ